ncbi:MAG TPA: hypothetical protein VED01_23715, partial [Burkholderiales bacterium]|nr:hypothetical protein [Burkholderiales bacterium]
MTMAIINVPADYASIQDAIDNATAGDTIVIAAGSFVGDIIIDKQLTIQGANQGVSGTDPLRGAESVIDGGIYVHADGVLLDGVQVLGGGTALAGNPAGIFVDTDGVTITNSVLLSDGTANTGIVTPHSGGVSGLTVSNNLIEGWGNGTYFNPTTQFIATGNTFDGNGVAVTGDDWAAGSFVDGNTFANSSFGDIGYGSFDAIESVGAYVGVNTTDGAGGRHGIFAYGEGADGDDLGQNITGTADGDYMADAVVVAGSDNGQTFTGAGGDDFLDMGAGNDTASFTAAVTTAMITPDGGNWKVTTGGGEGTDTLADVEIVDSAAAGNILLVGNGGFATMQDAINAAVNGDTILVAAGTYSGNVIVDKELTIIGMGDGDDVVLEGTFKSSNSIAGSVADFLKTAPSYSGAAGAGFTVSADNVTIQNLRVTSFLTGVELNSAAHTTIEDVSIDAVVNGIRKGNAAIVNDLDVLGGSISDGYIGIYLTRDTFSIGQDATDVTVDGTHFSNLNQKGVYAETLQGTTLFDNLVMNTVGQYGGGPAFGSAGAFGSGIDVNLKFGTYVGSITIEDFDFDGVGSSTGLDATGHFGGAAIAIKGRDDPGHGTYGVNPADVSGLAVTIQNGSIDGTSTGIRVGEPNKPSSANNVTGPDVTVTNVTIENNLQNAKHADVDNVSKSTLTVNGTGGDDSYTAANTATSTGEIVFNGLGGNDTFTSAKGNDSLNGGSGNDLLNGGAGADALAGGTENDTYVVDNAGDSVTEAADEGTDSVQASVDHVLAPNVENLTLLDAASNIEDFEDFALGAIANGENGWQFGGGGKDQEVVLADGDNAFRMSNDPGNADFSGPYTPALAATAGELGVTSADVESMTFSLQFRPANATADGSRLEIDFGNEAANDRVNFLVLEHTATPGVGLRIATAEPTTTADQWVTNTGLNGDFNFATGSRTLAAEIDPSAWHTLSLTVNFVPGQDNDVIDVYLDGAHIGQSTTFENFFDFHTGADHATAAEAHQANRVFFRAADGAGNPFAADGAGGNRQGFLIDEIDYRSFNNLDGTGNALDNVITGNSGANTLSGLGGNDTLHGQSGTDTAAYTGEIDADDITFIADTDPGAGVAPGWSVNAGAEGTDTLTGIEIIDDATGGNILLVGASYATIQEAINAAGSGDTIVIAEGTYAEQISIHGKTNLTIRAAVGSDVTIEAPTVLALNSRSWTDVNGNPGAADTGAALISIRDSSGIVIQDIAVDGLEKLSEPHGNRYTGVSSDNSTVTLDNVDVTGIRASDASGFFGVQDGLAVYAFSNAAFGTHSFTLTDSLIDNFQKQGVTVDSIDVTITGNTIDGVGIDGRIAQNGIYGFDIGGTISGNTITDIAYSDNLPADSPEWYATGIGLLGFGAEQAVTISGNNISVGAAVSDPGVEDDNGRFAGIDVTDWDGATVTINGNTITGNSVTGDLAEDQYGIVSIDSDTNIGTNTFANLSSNVSIGSDEDGATIPGSDGDDDITGTTGDDTITGGAGDDTIAGGDGEDTIVYTETITADDVTFVQDTDPSTPGDQPGWVVNGGAEGTDTITGIEIIETPDGNILLVGASFPTIQEAIDAAADGDTILVGPGTYNENLLVNKEVTIIGTGGDVVIEGTFKSDNGIAGTVADFLKTAASYSTVSGTGVTIAADNVTIQNLRITSFATGVVLNDGVDSTTIEDVNIDAMVVGIRKGSAAQVSDLNVLGGTISDGDVGMYLAKETFATGKNISDVTVDGTVFTNLIAKGIYAESLNGTTLFDNLVMNHVGEFGRGGPAFGTPQGGFGNGIDVNLKFGAYTGSITIQNFDLDNTGNSTGVDPTGHLGGAAIAIKGRDDPGHSVYGVNPADVSGLTVVIQNGSIDGTSTGIRVGEPGKADSSLNITGPAVTVTNVTIDNNLQNAKHGDFDNVSKSTLTVNGTGGDDSYTAANTATSAGE